MTNDSSDPLDSLLGGFSERKAKLVLYLVEQRTMQIQSQSEHLLDVFMNKESRSDIYKLFNREQLKAKSQTPLTIRDMERYAPQWKDLVPETANIRATLVHVLAQKYTFTAEDVPNIREAVGFDDPVVQTAFKSLYKEPLSTVYKGQKQSIVDAVVSKWFDAAMLHAVEDQLELINIPRGEILFSEGDDAEAMYIIIHGRMRVAIKDDHGHTVYRDKGRGELLGEMAILTGEKRSATITAIRDSQLLKLTKEAATRLATQYPQVMLHLTQMLAERLRMTGAQNSAPSAPNTIAIVPLSADVPLAQFVTELITALTAYGATLHITGSRLKTLISDDALQALDHDKDAAPIVAWLNHQEANHDFVLYEADPAPTTWTDRCIRQADRVLLVGMGGNSPDLTSLETDLAQTEHAWKEVRKDLVLIHASRDTLPEGTIRWLHPRQITRHYHIAMSSPADFQRVARGVAGRGIGLVLGGGGARAFAHIGVIRAIQEAGIPIDLIGGTSAGAVAAAVFALGKDHRDIVQATRLIFSTLNDYTLPLVSIMSGNKFLNTLKNYFGHRKLEDLWLDFFCVSSNLNKAEMMVHRHGLIYRALRASYSIPGVFPPVLENGDLLVDGSVMNNVPADVMREACERGTVIAVDVGDELDGKRTYHFGDSLSGWRVLASRLFPWIGKRLHTPHMMGVMFRSTLLSSIHLKVLNQDKIDLYLNPPVGRFGTFDLKACDEMVEIGYQYATEQFKAWKRSDDPHQAPQPEPDAVVTS